MQFNKLGSSGLEVSDVCLGTMTWGIQNTQADADSQLALALDAGINFIDTAEMYPVPPNQETYGDTERIIGHWLSRHPQKRQNLILMTKIAGPGLRYIRGGDGIHKDVISTALTDSLSRLRTDYIDVYQLHWTNRMSPHFAKHWPGQTNPCQIDPKHEREVMAGIVQALGEEIKQGRIRHWGLSDDTTWGIHTFLQLCEQLNVPRPVSIQNEFSLLHAKDWPYLIESCVLENIAYLPWSPLASGALTGKYLNNQRPQGSRWTLVQRNGLFRDTPMSQEAVAAYVKVASKAKITPAQLALKWVQQTHGVTSTIIGATSCAQLQENMDAFALNVDDQIMSDVTEVFARYPIPF